MWKKYFEKRYSILFITMSVYCANNHSRNKNIMYLTLRTSYMANKLFSDL